MEKTCPDLPGFPTYTKQNICDNTLDNAQLVTRCPLDNGRYTDASIPPRCSAGQLDRLPAELLIQVLLYTDLPSLTRFRRVNRRAMELVDSVPQYDAIIKHCPNIIRAILSIQAGSFNCNILYTTLSTTRCSTRERFGDHLYLIDCRRVCYFCFTRRLEYFPLTIGHASRFFTPDGTQQRSAITSRQNLRAASPPSVLSLPGRYCNAWANDGGNLVRKRLQLFDRQAVIQDLASSGLPKVDTTTREPQRFMAIITAPHLFDSGLQADWGYFCLGCKDTRDMGRSSFVTGLHLSDVPTSAAPILTLLCPKVYSASGIAELLDDFVISHIGPFQLGAPSSSHQLLSDHAVSRSYAAQRPSASRAHPYRSLSRLLSSQHRFSAMNAPQERNSNVRLLACLVDEDDTYDSDYRFLVDGQHVKYISTAPGTFRGAEDDRTFEPILLGELFPPFPTGDWNHGHAARDPETGKATFVRTETVQLAGVKNLWHPVKLNELDFARQDRVRQRVHVSTHPEVKGGKLAVWPWEIPYIEVETAAYQWISDSGCMSFVVGFVAEWVQGARAAGPADMDGCKKALGRLHELGIKLGDINKHNFLVRDGHDVVLVDFEMAKRDCSSLELEDEMSALRSNLEDTSFRGGVEPAYE
ncbi:hypothetical protein FZEAL_1893 [Fusarium zealandicum]|uniref:F-box domain-containing protein n=1 Tax=Fusarium zealandicum TaxID=1053134 RepID=A0A8H4USC5_9HYPO|nr:hypothetical protein FZEAL_1893 [Fusarium zealandicum]